MVSGADNWSGDIGFCYANDVPMIYSVIARNLHKILRSAFRVDFF